MTALVIEAQNLNLASNARGVLLLVLRPRKRGTYLSVFYYKILQTHQYCPIQTSIKYKKKQSIESNQLYHARQR